MIISSLSINSTERLNTMKNKSYILKNAVIMTAVNLIMKSAGVGFNSFLTSRIGSDGMGLFQLVISIYSLAITFSCAGIRLASTRITVEIKSLHNKDAKKSVTLCVTYAGICGCIIGFSLLTFSDFIASSWLGNLSAALPLRILSPALPFVAMSSALGGYFTATGQIPQYSFIQMIEQAFKIVLTVMLLNKYSVNGGTNPSVMIVTGMSVAEAFSFILSYILENITIEKTSDLPRAKLADLLRISVPDGIGTIIRNILLTVEHLLIPKGFEKSGTGGKDALSAYGNIYAMAMPILLYPSAFLSSLSSLLIPLLAEKNEKNDKKSINNTINKTLKISFIYSIICACIFYVFSSGICSAVYKSKEAAKYTKILSPLVPIMYLDMITDGILKGLDQQVYSMRYNIIDSSLCVILVYFMLPKYAVKGYITILYISELINFYLSFGRLTQICEIRFFQAPSEDIPKLFESKKYSAFRKVYEYHTYRGRKKRSQVL